MKLGNSLIFRNNSTIIYSQLVLCMKTGTIKFFNATKGYGFIKEDGTDKEIFVHITGLVDQPVNTGDKVTYDEQDGRKGLNAINVKKA